MDRFIERCAALDVHRDSIRAAVRYPGGDGSRAEELQSFKTTTRGLLTLRDWLAAHRVTVVAMESTGVYWKPVYYVLEDDFECWLVNARHAKNVPGRKTDTADASWLCQLVEHGLVRPSFVPPPPIRELRDLTRYRKSLIRDRAEELQRLDKMLQDAGMKLSSVASDIMGVSGRSMILALIDGIADPAALAELAKGRLRAKLPQLQEALEGHFRPHHARLCARILAHIDYLEESIEDLSAQIQEAIAPFGWAVDLLKTIPGIQQRLAEVIIAEIGVDMNQFPTHRHLASWAGMCPGNNESAGKRKSGRTRKGSKYLRNALTDAATSASATKDTYLAAQHRRFVARQGRQAAKVSLGHTILTCIYYMLQRRETYHDLGADFFHKRNAEAQVQRLVRQLEVLGHHVSLQPVSQPT